MLLNELDIRSIKPQHSLLLNSFLSIEWEKFFIINREKFNSTVSQVIHTLHPHCQFGLSGR